MRTRSNGRPGFLGDRLAAELLRRAAKGDHKSFLELHDRYGPELYAYLDLVLTDAVDAEQATYDVLERALQHSREYLRGPVPFRVWLFWLAHERVGPARTRRRRPDHEDPLASLITRLPVGCREALVLHRLLGFSISEVALIIRRTPRAVSVFEARALETLGGMLASIARESASPHVERPAASERLAVRMRSRESPVSIRRRWALALR